MAVEVPSLHVALYRHFNKAGELLYVGVALSPVMRTSAHSRSAFWYKAITRIEIQWCKDRQTALKAERAAIETEKPLHNFSRGLRNWKPTLRETIIRDSGTAIVEAIIRLRPVYTVDQAAALLEITRTDVLYLIESDEIGYIEIAPGFEARERGWKRQRDRHAITGWQILEFLKSREAEQLNHKRAKKREDREMREAAGR